MKTNALSGSEQFIKLYLSLESAIRKKYGYDDSPVKNAAEKELSHYKDELTTLRNLRNVLSHSKPFGTEYCAEPHQKMINTLKNILEEVDDTLIIKHCVRINNVAFAGMDDSVLEYMNLLRDRVYTHIPILDEKKRVLGVFGESTWLSASLNKANEGDFQLLDKDTKFREFEEELKLESHTTESFVFVSKYSTVLDVKYEFQKVFNSEKKRLGMVFITENGHQSEALLGIITAWGVLGREIFNEA